MDRILAQALAFLRGLTATQKIMLAGTLVIVGVVLYAFVRLFGAADYKNLYTGLDPADTQKIIQRLAAESVSYQVASDGTSIEVPADKLDRIRVEMASQNLPHTGRIGFELFDKPNWSSSDFSEKVNYQRALEAELERTIETMDTVESARVHLVLPHESLFTSEERPAKAAVVVKLRTQRNADETVNAIANLVASAWENLSPADVTIVSADGQLPLNKGHRGGGGTRGDLSDLETTMAERIVDTLAPVVGADHVKSSVTVEYDSNSGETTQEQYDPNAVATLTSQITQDETTGTPAAGIPGTPSNVPSAPATPAQPGAAKPGSGQSNPAQASPSAGVTTASSLVQGMRNESKTFAVSRTVHHTIEPPGQIRRMAAAVLVDDAIDVQQVNGKRQETRRKRTPEEMKQLEDLVRAAVGFDAKRGDELAMRNISFQAPPVEAPEKPTVAQLTLRKIEPWTGLLRYAGVAVVFVVVYLLILRPMARQALATIRALPSQAAQGAAVAAGGSKVLLSPGELERELEQELSETGSEVARAVALKRHLVDKVKREPDGASRLIQSWTREHEEES